jgi:alkanesulfonate monooxygenase SsuD/methylene tetrahydromethanopterin reductase-like flavin-dependent oxidoreductase (luciferase family)
VHAAAEQLRDPPRIGFGVPRWVGNPSESRRGLHHAEILDYGRQAEQLGFDAVWVADHFYYEWPQGVFEPFPEAWTLLTAIGISTKRVQIGSMALAAAFRHPALLAKMAGALQELAGGRLLLGIGAGNQVDEHAAIGLEFAGRVSRLEEYLDVIHGLLANESVTFEGRYYTLRDASLRRAHPRVPIWLAGEGPRMLALAARHADGWNGGNGLSSSSFAFERKLRAFRSACTQQGRNPEEVTISCSANVLVLPDRNATQLLIQHVRKATGWSAAKVRDEYVIGTPDEVAERLVLAREYGVHHIVCSLGGRPFTLWSDAMLELFGTEVLPRIRSK